MRDIITAFAALWVIIALGWLIGRTRLLGAGAEEMLSRLVFVVAVPALLLATIATTPVAGVFTLAFVPFVVSTVAVAAATAVLAWRRWRLGRGEATVATMCASYVNGGYLGIPVALLVLGDASFAVPVLLFQVLLVSPLALAQLDTRPGVRGLLSLPLRNPIIPASVLGLAVTVADWSMPAGLLRPLELLGSAAVPLALVALGMSLGGARPLRRGTGAWIRVGVVAAKVLVQPAVAYGVALLLGLQGNLLLAAVVMSGLPTAQNVFVFASRFGRAPELARDAVTLSTVLAAVTVTLAAAALG